MEASGDKSEVVYMYDVFRPKENINAIYDDMPLGVWWPWPKR